MAAVKHYRIVLADAGGVEIGDVTRIALSDFEVGDEDDSFEIQFFRAPTTVTLTRGMRIYIPGTEYGGIITETTTDTEDRTYTVSGVTWRGMLDQKIITPPAGAEFRYLTGNLQAVADEVLATYGGLFHAEETPVALDHFRVERFASILTAFNAICRAQSLKMAVTYTAAEGARVRFSTVATYDAEVGFSANLGANYRLRQLDGINHLICTGSWTGGSGAGSAVEMTDEDVNAAWDTYGPASMGVRGVTVQTDDTGEAEPVQLVLNLYADAQGHISTIQHYTGREERAAVYETSAGDVDTIRDRGERRLRSIMGGDRYDIAIDARRFDFDLEIGDYVHVNDYLSGFSATAQIGGIICKMEGDTPAEIEYRIRKEQGD